MIIKNYKKLIFTFLTFFIFCFFIFVICESVLRIVSSSKNHNLSFNHNYHEQLGWINPKKTINYIKKMDYQSTVSINSLGLRNKEIGIKKKKRVGIFGDSMTQAIQVNDDKTFTYLLDEMLDQYEVINFGVRNMVYQNYLI